MLTPSTEKHPSQHPTRVRTRRGSRPCSRALVPALDPQANYLSRLSARSALYTDLRLLLADLNEPLPSARYRSLVVDENRLARASAAGRAKIWKELKTRYILNREEPLFLAFWNEWCRCHSEPERGLTAYVLLALNDRLVADLGTQWLFPLLRRAPAELRVEEVLNFVLRAATLHPEVQDWSTETCVALAKKYLTSLRDFGLAQGIVKKATVRPALYAAPARLLVRALRLAGVREIELVQAPIFRLIGLDGLEVIDALSELHRREELRFKIQADIVEIGLEMGR
jgi:BrxA